MRITTWESCLSDTPSSVVMQKWEGFPVWKNTELGAELPELCPRKEHPTWGWSLLPVGTGVGHTGWWAHLYTYSHLISLVTPTLNFLVMHVVWKGIWSIISIAFFNTELCIPTSYNNRLISFFIKDTSSNPIDNHMCARYI